MILYYKMDILQKLNSFGITYLYENYNKIISENGQEYFDTYFNLSLQELGDWKTLGDEIIDNPKLLNSIIVSDNLTKNLKSIIYFYNGQKFEKQYQLYDLLFSNEITFYTIINIEYWIQNSIYDLIFNLKYDDNFNVNIKKLKKIFTKLLKNKEIKNELLGWLFNSKDKVFQFNLNIAYLMHLYWSKGKNKKNDLYIRSESNTFLEKTFFLTFKYFSNSIIEILETIDKYDLELRRLTNLIESYKSDETEDENINGIVTAFRVDKMKKDKALMEEDKKKLVELLNKPKIIILYNKFLKDYVELTDINNLVDDDFSSIIKGYKFLLSKGIDNFTPKSVNFIISLLSKKYTNNPHVRGDYCCFLTHLFMKDILHSYLFNGINNKDIIINFINLYNDLEKTDANKYLIRGNISYLIISICYNKNYLNNLIEYSDSKEFKKFINLVLNDLTSSLDDALNKIKEKKLDDVNEIKWSILLAKDMLNLVNFLSKQEKIKKVFVISEIKTRFIDMLNFYLIKLVSKESKNYIIKNPRLYGFYPIEILHQIGTIFINCYDVLEDINIELLEKMISILLKGDKLKWEDNGKLYNLLDRLKKSSKKIVYENVPSEFCDPISMDIIHKPIVLPDVDLIVEEDIIKRHLLTEEINPFNRKKLTVEDLEEYNKKEEIVKRIEEFTSKLNEWKKNYI